MTGDAAPGRAAGRCGPRAVGFTGTADMRRADKTNHPRRQPRYAVGRNIWNISPICA
mgnify:CR=1 FL=1